MTAKPVNFDTFNKRVYELITAVKQPTLKKLLENKPAIDALAEYCKKSPLQTVSPEKAKEFFKDKQDPLDLYEMMLDKIWHAPVKLMADGVIILYMPKIAELLEAKPE